MKAFTVLSLLLSLAGATPVDLVEKDNGVLHKRSSETVYLENCVVRSTNSPDRVYSAMTYYHGEANGNSPAPQNFCKMNKDKDTYYVNWSLPWSCTFPTGVTFQYNGQGRGSNGKTWYCSDDGSAFLYEAKVGETDTTCHSMVKCAPA